MSLHDRIKEARKNRGITQSELGELIGVAKTTVAGYEKNREPTAAQLGLIADVLDVGVSFLLQDEIKRHHEYTATPDEMENIIKKYRTLDGYGKDAVQAILDLEYNRCADAALVDETPKVISLRLSEQSAAAGTGTYLGPEQFRTIYVKESDIARRAAYCIPVSGDSMEPVYRDGDILLVSSEQAKIGDIGIFTLSGKGYVKKRGNDVLLSLNGKYVPIPMDESIVCNGKVIGVLDKSEIVSNG